MVSRANPLGRVLVVEDHPDGREAMQAVLQLFGYEVRSAGDGPSGVEAAAEFRPDYAVVDIGLPGFDGLEVARRLRGMMGPAVKIIALTAWGDEATRHKAAAAGFDAYFVKPADLGVLCGQMAGDPGVVGA